jgi:hypothetical protein
MKSEEVHQSKKVCHKTQVGDTNIKERELILINDVNDSFKRRFIDYYKVNNYAQTLSQRTDIYKKKQ